MNADGTRIFGQGEPDLHHLSFQLIVIERRTHHRPKGMGDVIVCSAERNDLGDVKPLYHTEQDVCEDTPPKMRLNPLEEHEIGSSFSLRVVEGIPGNFNSTNRPSLMVATGRAEEVW